MSHYYYYYYYYFERVFLLHIVMETTFDFCFSLSLVSLFLVSPLVRSAINRDAVHSNSSPTLSPCPLSPPTFVITVLWGSAVETWSREQGSHYIHLNIQEAQMLFFCLFFTFWGDTTSHL